MAKGEERSGLKRRGSGECNARQSRGLRLTIDHKGTPKAGDIRSWHWRRISARTHGVDPTCSHRYDSTVF